MQLFEWPALAWLALAILAAVLEISIPHFGAVFVSAAAIAAAGAAALSAGVPVQLLTFAVVIVVSFVVLRPWFVGRAGRGGGIPSRTDQLIGKEAVVTNEINPTTGGGRVNVGGEDWAARSDTTVTIGTRVRVTGADGIVLVVSISTRI
jgi:membrane protein implicated in regulation of membrane protease activity